MEIQLPNKISGVLICQDEIKNILNLIKNIYDYVAEIIILDGGSVDNTLETIKLYKHENDTKSKIKIFQSRFNGNFGDQKNLALSKVSYPWVLNLDADETLQQEALDNLKNLIEDFSVDVYAFPRVNTINNKKTDIWPDYQLRLFKSFCRFIYPVHEELVGWRKRVDLSDEQYINHHKSQTKQWEQDQRYECLEKEYKQFMRIKEEN